MHNNNNNRYTRVDSFIFIQKKKVENTKRFIRLLLLRFRRDFIDPLRNLEDRPMAVEILETFVRYSNQ